MMRCRLRRGSRKEVQALIARWEAREPDGDPVPDTVPLPAPGGPVSAGAPSLPAPLADPHLGLPTVPAPDHPDEVWLAAVPTDQLWPMHGSQGPTSVPLVVACSDRRNALVALHPDGAPPTVLPLAHGALPLDGRAWTVRGLSLKPRAPSALAELVDTLLPVVDPDDRWAIVMRQALISGEPGRALAVLADAVPRGRARACWTHLTQICMALHEGAFAVAAAWMALAVDPDLDVQAVLSLHATELTAMARAIRQDRLVWPDVRRVAGDALDALAEVPDPPPLLPWPPSGAQETWAAALALHGRFDRARGLWQRTPPGPRRDVGVAALAEAGGATIAAASWREAAGSTRKAGGDGYALLDRAITLDERALDHWRYAAWAWRDGRVDAARERWTRAIALDQGGGVFAYTLDVPGLLEIARIGLEHDARRVAARVYRRCVEHEPGELEHRVQLARILEAAGRLRRAAEVWTETGRAWDQEIVPQDAIRRWELWVEAAGLFARAGAGDEAVVALREALAADFLDLEAWISVLSAEVELPETLRTWWQHVYRVLAGEGALAGLPLPAPASIDDATLDALHPGGAGWLARLRSRLETPDPPSFAELTRGLDRLREAELNDTAAVVEELSETLELEDPPTGHVFRGSGAWGISAWPARPPVLLIGVQHLREGDRHLDPAALRFAVAAELVHLRCGHPVLTFDASWLGTSRSVYDQVNVWAGTAETVFDLVTLLPGLDQARKVQTLVKLARTAFRARGAVDKAVNLADPVASWLGWNTEVETRGLSREGLSGAALQFRVHAERAALLLTGDLRSAVDALLVLSTDSAAHVERVRTLGLATVLADPASGLSGDELLRLTTLVSFATSHMPWRGVPTDDAGG